MMGKRFSLRGQLVKRAAPLAIAFAALALSATGVHAQSVCKPLVGHYVEHAVAEGCDAPTGLCIAGEYSGVLKGTFEGKATSPFNTNPTGAGDILDLQIITGGTGDFAGASGAIHASGFFVNGSGESEYTGTLCLP
jgi:hypothetical protein